MPYKPIGTLMTVLLYGLLLNLGQLIFHLPLASSEMDVLTENENEFFFLSHEEMGVTSETFLTDKYIDEDQARILSDMSRPPLNTPADGNYPFTLVDHYILDSDLEIEYTYNTVLCSTYPSTAYLSRHDISITDYTDEKRPPAFAITVVKGVEPFTGEKVKAMHLEVRNYENFANEMRHKSTSPGEDCYTGYVSNTYVRVDSAQAAVWIRKTDTELLKRCNPPVEYTTCLHPSEVRRQPEPIRLIRISSDNPCIGEPYLPEPPRSDCYYPLPPERTTPAATNWSYMQRVLKGSSDFRQNAIAPNSGFSCPTCK